jgi:hypothetical protein
VGLDGGKIPAGACAYGICRRLWSLPSAGGTGDELRKWKSGEWIRPLIV